MPPKDRTPPRFNPPLELIFELQKKVDQGFRLPVQSWTYTLPALIDDDSNDIVTLKVDI